MSIARIRWLVAYLAGVGVVLGGLGFATALALRLERQEREARAEARLQESLRLALWRMESTLAPIIAREAARSYEQYDSFMRPDRPVGRMGPEPSPLLLSRPRFVRLHFQRSEDGTVWSPQVPATASDLEPALALGLDEARLRRDRATLEELDLILRRDPLSLEYAAAASPTRAAGEGTERPTTDESAVAADDPQRDFDDRERLLDAVRAPEVAAEAEVLGKPSVRSRAAAQLAEIWPPPQPGPLRAAWRTDPASGSPELLLYRTVRLSGDQVVVQGLWLDWPSLRRHLLGEVLDLLPGADLAPVDPEQGARAVAGGDSPRRLAAIPAVLQPSPLPPPPSPRVTPARLMLVMAWMAVLIAAVALGLVLRTAAGLAERRARFVSAVTHELRTPLTSFRLYTRLLSGSADDPEKRRAHLEVLSGEAERLQRTVENVLAYAQLERRDTTSCRPCRLDALLDRVRGPLARRLELAGLKLEIDDTEAEPGAVVLVDEDAVERILLNLADNTCRHGAPEGATRLRIGVRAPAPGSGGRRREAGFIVSDDGPGVPDHLRSQIFDAFRGAGGERSGGGLGLGLALCRSLARAQGGELELLEDDPQRGRGAAFSLRLVQERPEAVS